MNIKSLTLFLLVCYSVQIRSEVVIELFQENRDMPAIQKILDTYRSVLAYEASGCKEGTTKGYLVNPEYITKVLRVDGKTVGFINYTIEEPPFLLKLFMNSNGLVHLMGVESKHQSKGYGKVLLDHVLQELKGKDIHKVLLCVKTENNLARKFYEKEGFICAIPEQIRSSFQDLFYAKNL